MGLLDDPKLMDRHEQSKRYSVEFKAGLAQSLPDPERHVDARHARRTLAHQRNWPGTAWLSFCAERDRRQCQQTEGRDWSYTGSAVG